MSDLPQPSRLSEPTLAARIAATRPRAKARLMGVCEALEGLTSSYGQVVVLGKLVVGTSAAATAANLLAHPRLLWFGFGISVLGALFHVAWTLLFYELMLPVQRSVSRLALGVMLVGSAIQAVAALFYIVPLLVLQSASALPGFTAPQLDALALIFLKVNSRAFELDLVFFGLWCVLAGWLIFRSTFLPRLLGVLLAIDGLGWLLYLHPPLAHQLFPFVAAASAIAEIPLQLWLLIVGLDPERWKEQAARAGAL